MKFSASIVTLLLALAAGGPALFGADATSAEPKTPRDFFNAGTRALAEKKFPDAEKWFKDALATQNEAIQPQALFNLGHVRFADGMETLKKQEESAAATMQRAKKISSITEQVLQQGRSAMADNDVRRMVGSYQAGRGLRKELRLAQEAVRKAIETYGATLRKWQRAADDFKGAAEMNPADTSAKQNAEIVEQYIARLVDSLREMQAMENALGMLRLQLQTMLDQLKGRIPKEDAPPGAEGDEEEEPEPGQPQGQSEAPSKDGEEMPMSPETAGQLLEQLAPNGNRRLPMSDEQTKQPKEKKGRTW